MEEETPAAVSSVMKEKSSKVSDLINRFEGGSSLNPSDLKKDSSVLHITKSQGRYGSTASPQPKLPSQLSLQKQGNSTTDKTQVAQLHTANGVVAQDQPEDEDPRLSDRGSNVCTPIPDDAMDSNLINGEGESSCRDSLQSVSACEEQMPNSCHRTPSGETLLPSQNETLEIHADVKEEPAEEITKQDQPVETKETDEQKRHKIANELLQTEKAYVS
uniref:Uncharacterized protein n=1 Tax=Malurus cyaneus samueli TaxID=2593467 RepID=A0A8C5UHP6_9PASS